MDNRDYYKEGFYYMEKTNQKIWDKKPIEAFNEWREEGGEYWVIDFELINITKAR